MERVQKWREDTVHLSSMQHRVGSGVALFPCLHCCGWRQAGETTRDGCFSSTWKTLSDNLPGAKFPHHLGWMLPLFCFVICVLKNGSSLPTVLSDLRQEPELPEQDPQSNRWSSGNSTEDREEGLQEAEETRTPKKTYRTNEPKAHRGSQRLNQQSWSLPGSEVNSVFLSCSPFSF